MRWLLAALVTTACSTSSTPAPIADAAIADAGEDTAVICNAKCTLPTVCCQNQCVQTDNDPASCGSCGVHCSGATPYCDNGNCAPQPCAIDASTCANPLGCCGGACCDGTQICCKERGTGKPFCHTPNGQQPSCP